ncbi:kinesin-like protein KIF26B isoform X2 [Entelurus aequoreus]|nr:kinesin-like protein KIF26B isoform X2 [Entelurus aequoreus]
MYHHRAEPVPSYKSLPGSGGGHRSAGLGLCERKDASCERCSATLVALKKQALSLSVHHHFSCKETSQLSAFLLDNLRVHSRSGTESRDRGCWDQGQCAVCGTKVHLLKQEAVRVALSRGPTSGTMRTGLGPSAVKLGDRSASQPHGLDHSPQSPRTPRRTPQTLRRRSPKQDMEEHHHHYHHRGSNPDGVTFYAHHQAAEDNKLRCTDLVHASSKMPHLSKVVAMANSAAMSFLARAAEKLNMTLRKKGQNGDADPARVSKAFRDLIQKSPPPVPSCLLQAATRTRDSPNVGKVKVVLRVNPTTNEGQPPVLHVDPGKKRAILLENLHQSSSSRDLLKAFHYEAVYPQDSTQTEVCAGVLNDVIRCVLSGSDGCVLGLGCADVGCWSSMLGNADSVHTLGLIPCAISWLYGAVDKRREKTWTDMMVWVSAVEVCCGEEDSLRDLLGDLSPSGGHNQDHLRGHLRLQEDHVAGMQSRKHTRVKALTAERAASLLDVAVAARRRDDLATFLSHSSVMFFTLHVQPLRTDNSPPGKGCRGPSRLTMIDVCSRTTGGNIRNKSPLSDLGPAVLTLLSGSKTLPKKGNKLAMLLGESLGHVTCHTTVVAQVTNSLARLHDTSAVLQLASRIRRTQRRTQQSGSPSGRSLTRQKRGPPSFSLRAFHSTDEVDVDVQHFRLRGQLDERSSSDQSCDTVIQIDSDGLIRTRAPAKLAQPEFVPIIPSLHPNKADMDDPEFTALLQELLKIPKLHVENKKDDAQGLAEGLKADLKQPERDCLKCDTFAELQERLGCIDGSEETMDLLKSASKVPSVNSAPPKPQSLKEKANTESFEAPQTLKQGLGSNQILVREKQTDGAVPGDNFQREDSGLYDCEECSATSSSEEPLNQSLNRNTTFRYQIRKTGAQSSQDVNVKTQGIASTDCTQPTEKPESHEAADWLKADKRTSPVGNSLPASPPSPPCSSSNPVAGRVAVSDTAASQLTKDAKEMKATITVTVQQPLDLTGHDELVFSMVEEVTITGALDSGRTGGNIICIKDAAQSTARRQGSGGFKPIQIISNISDEATAAGLTNVSKCTIVHPGDTATETDTLLNPSRRERILPSFINPMLMNPDEQLENVKDKEITPSHAELKGNTRKCPEAASETLRQYAKICKSCDSMVLEGASFSKDTAGNQMHPGDFGDVSSTNPSKASVGQVYARRRIGNTTLTGASLGCLETTSASFNTGSLPRSWLDANLQESHSHTADGWRDARGVTSSTPCSPGVTLERRRDQQCSPVNQSFYISSSLKYDPGDTQGAKRPFRKGIGSLFDSSQVGMKHDHMPGRMMSPLEESGRNEMNQLTSRTSKSLRRNHYDVPTSDKGRSSTSLIPKVSSSKRSSEGLSRGAHKGKSVGDSTLPRTSRSSRKTRQTSHGHNSISHENEAQSRPTHSKLSAVGKLKISYPKVRRLSSPSIKNLSPAHKSLQESINRSASLSPDFKTVSFERASSSSPPHSFHSISRTPSQSSTCSSTKSAIQGFTNGCMSDLLKDRTDSPALVGLDQTGSLFSPYSQVTSPHTPPHLSGHASDTTSVLSGDLPPAMGKTSLYFSNRNSTMSSGYDSLRRDSEATLSSASTSGRSASLLREVRSSRSSRRRGNTGAHPRHPSSDTTFSTRQSSNGAQSRWADHTIPEKYDVKVYDVDRRQRTQKKTGARVLQRQAAVLGVPTSDDRRRQIPVQQPENRGGPTQVRAGIHRVEPRLTHFPDFQGRLSGAPGGP